MFQIAFQCGVSCCVMHLLYTQYGFVFSLLKSMLCVFINHVSKGSTNMSSIKTLIYYSKVNHQYVWSHVRIIRKFVDGRHAILFLVFLACHFICAIFIRDSGHVSYENHYINKSMSCICPCYHIICKGVTEVYIWKSLKLVQYLTSFFLFVYYFYQPLLLHTFV